VFTFANERYCSSPIISESTEQSYTAFAFKRSVNRSPNNEASSSAFSSKLTFENEIFFVSASFNDSSLNKSANWAVPPERRYVTAFFCLSLFSKAKRRLNSRCLSEILRDLSFKIFLTDSISASNSISISSRKYSNNSEMEISN